MLHVIETLGRGGAETALLAGLPALAARGWNVSVLALSEPQYLASALRAARIDVHVVRRSMGTLGWLPTLGWLRQRHPDIVHTHLFSANVVGRLLGRAFGARVVTTLHNPDYGAEGPGRLGARRTLDRLSVRIARPTFVAVSNVVEADFAKEMGFTSTICPNSLDSFWLADGPTRAQARSLLGIAPDQHLAFSCGRLHSQKGFEMLSAVARRVPRVRFVVAGQGPDRLKLEAASALELVGIGTREFVQRWLAACDVVVIPSRYESFCVFALEAMAMGRPIVASDVEGLRDTLTPIGAAGPAARLVAPDDEAGLCAAIEALLDDEPERNRLVASGRMRARDFSSEAWGTFHHDLYSRLLQERSP